uniref:Uncharacterized protein n=1 Tax=Myotis myotis TaxID=51298 RepID=A0A7J7S2V3_MYOMY|nr:hypothetical protein mMyoMyo1_010111 [Myotis myotis]
MACRSHRPEARGGEERAGERGAQDLNWRQVGAECWGAGSETTARHLGDQRRELFLQGIGGEGWAFCSPAEPQQSLVQHRKDPSDTTRPRDSSPCLSARFQPRGAGANAQAWSKLGPGRPWRGPTSGRALPPVPRPLLSPRCLVSVPGHPWLFAKASRFIRPNRVWDEARERSARTRNVFSPLRPPERRRKVPTKEATPLRLTLSLRGASALCLPPPPPPPAKSP